jgi:DNA-binding CsgD family transcriptional regulator
MEIIKYDQLRRSWNRIARENPGEIAPQFELEIHKKLLNTFHVGPFYYYILNVPQMKVEHVSDGVIEILGLENKEQFTVENVFRSIHPDDLNRFVAHEARLTEFFRALAPEKVMKYKVNYDYRLRCSNGEYIWILMQIRTIQTNDEGAVIRVLGVHTNISHLKQDDKPSGLSFYGLDGEPSFLNVNVPGFMHIDENDIFTMREKEILRLIVEGKTSREIAEILFLSTHTVSTHRKNILAKSGCRNITELLVTAVSKRWV